MLKGELLPGAWPRQPPRHRRRHGGSPARGPGTSLNWGSVAHGTVTFWLSLDPWLVGAALLLSPIALARRNTRAIALAYLIQVAMILRPGYLPAMYVIALLPFAALIVAGVIQALWRFATDDHRRRMIPAGQARWRAAGSRVGCRVGRWWLRPHAAIARGGRRWPRSTSLHAGLALTARR